MWYLMHKREYKFISCASYNQVVNEYYRQWRDSDGSIPWEIKYSNTNKIYVCMDC